MPGETGWKIVSQPCRLGAKGDAPPAPRGLVASGPAPRKLDAAAKGPAAEKPTTPAKSSPCKGLSQGACAASTGGCGLTEKDGTQVEGLLPAHHDGEEIGRETPDVVPALAAGGP